MKTKISNALLVIGLLIILVTLALFPMRVDNPTAGPTSPTTTGLFVFPTITTGPPLPPAKQTATALEDARATATWEAFYGYGD